MSCLYFAKINVDDAVEIWNRELWPEETENKLFEQKYKDVKS